jgi:hypothetical protein
MDSQRARVIQTNPERWDGQVIDLDELLSIDRELEV